jgi:tRNA pseudouridine55 synthase
MNILLNVYKPIGLSPNQAIQLVRKHFPEYKNEKIGYAGRLDPLAHGVLLLMVGESTKQKDTFLNLPKTYEFVVLFGVATDTYDTLGLLKNTKLTQTLPTQQKIESFIKSKLGSQTQTYPPYSSKTVSGKPLHWWARNNKLSEITIPQRQVTIDSFTLVNLQTTPAAEIKQTVLQQIESVEGDFRQKEIKNRWEEWFSVNNNQTFYTARFKLSCSSGTYVRVLAHELGKKLGSGAIAFEILRIKVGSYSLDNAIKLV